MTGGSEEASAISVDKFFPVILFASLLLFSHHLYNSMFFNEPDMSLMAENRNIKLVSITKQLCNYLKGSQQGDTTCNLRNFYANEYCLKLAVACLRVG